MLATILKNFNTNEAYKQYAYLLELYKDKQDVTNLYNSSIQIINQSKATLIEESNKVIDFIKSHDLIKEIETISDKYLIELRIFIITYIMAPLVFANDLDLSFINNIKNYLTKDNILNMIKGIISKIK